MSQFYLELHKAQEIVRDEYGRPSSWRQGKLVEKFTDPKSFLDFVTDNGAKLKNVVAFSGSATLLSTANGIIADQAKRAGVL
jgi:hypothetical protein